MKIVYMVGSLSPMFLNRGLAKVFVPLTLEGVEFVGLDVDSLPLYSRGYDGNWPKITTAFKKVVDKAGGVIIITPEHNRVYPTVVANIVKWSSHPWETTSLEGKPVALTGVSPSLITTGIAQTYLRGPLMFFGSKLYPHEAYIDAQQAGITPKGGATEGLHGFLAQFIGGFVDFIKASERLSPERSPCASVSQRDRSVRRKPPPSPEALRTATERV